MADTRPIRIGIVGLGRAGLRMHCKELKGRQKKFQIVAGCDPIRQRRDLLAKKYNCRTYGKIKDLIADPNVELVDVANRTSDHVPDALAGLKGGKTVFLEKPIATCYAEARKLKSAVARSKGKLYIRHNMRFAPAYQHIREIIASGILGEVYEIKLRRNKFLRRDDWQTLKSCNGGLLLNWGPHIIDHGLRFLESPLVNLWSDLKKVAAVGDAEDHLKIIMVGKNGRVIDLEISGGAAITESEYLVFGNRGALSSDSVNIHLRYLDPKKKLRVRRAKSGTPTDLKFGDAETLKWIDKTIKVAPKAKCAKNDIWDYLYSAIRQRKKFPITLDESLEVMKVISLVKKGTPFANA